MENSKKIISNLKAEASMGNFQKIKIIFERNNFNQKEIDEAFRQCIFNYNNNKKESYINCIKLFLKKTQEINFRNSKYNNTTILMYSIDQSKESPTDLIISCSKDDLDMNLTDSNGENTIFHLANNKIFTQKIKIDFVKDLCLNDYYLYSKNKANKTIEDILKSRGEEQLLDEIINKIKENHFDQNKLTTLYNENNYNDLFNFLKKFEKESDKNDEYINKNSIKYNKPFIGLKAIISALDKQNKSEYDIQRILESQKINDLTLEMMKILYRITFENIDWNNINSTNSNIASTYSLCLIINKMIMFYQLDYYYDFVYLTEQIKTYDNYISTPVIIYHLYKYFIKIDMLIQRGCYTKVNDEFDKIKNLISNIEQKKNNNKKNSKYDEIIIPKDIIFEYKNIKNLFKLYQIYINSLTKKENCEDYENEINELKSLKFEENEGNNKQIINIKNDSNIKNFQKYLYLKLNYLKYSNDKIPYKIDDNLGILNITGTNIESQINKIYFYHYIGIISLKNKNYTISTYFFLKCLNLISKQSSMLLIKRNHFYPVILYNLSLSYFYSKKYNDAIKSLYLLLNYSNNKSKFFVNYKYIYYRLGLSNLKILMQENKEINLLYNSYINNKFILKTSKTSSFYEKLDVIEYFKKAFILIKNNPNDPIYFSTLINLAFCFILKENYSQAIFYLKMNKSKNINHINIIRGYLLQCYIYINKLNLAEKISKEMILDDKLFKNSNSDIKFYEKLNSRFLLLKGYKISFLVNLIKLSVEQKKIKDIRKYLMLILDSIKLDISFGEQGKLNVNEEIPTYIINVFVYYYLVINRKDLALDIIKKRKIKEIII